jgi:hypothetical protein
MLEPRRMHPSPADRRGLSCVLLLCPLGLGDGYAGKSGEDRNIQ